MRTVLGQIVAVVLITFGVYQAPGGTTCYGQVIDAVVDWPDTDYAVFIMNRGHYFAKYSYSQDRSIEGMQSIDKWPQLAQFSTQHQIVGATRGLSNHFTDHVWFFSKDGHYLLVKPKENYYDIRKTQNWTGFNYAPKMVGACRFEGWGDKLRFFMSDGSYTEYNLKQDRAEFSWKWMRSLMDGTGIRVPQVLVDNATRITDCLSYQDEKVYFFFDDGNYMFLKLNDNNHSGLKNIHENWRGLKLPSEGRYNEGSYLTAHNAFATPEQGYDIPAMHMQEGSLTQQLDAGARALMLDVWDLDDWEKASWHTTYLASTTFFPGYYAEQKEIRTPGGIFLAHNLSGNGLWPGVSIPRQAAPTTLFSALMEIQIWMAANRSEIVTIFLEDYVGNNKKVFDVFQATGLDRYMWVQKNSGNVVWPKLSEMRAQDKRLVVFTDHEDHGHRTPCFGNNSHNLMYTYDFVNETLYNLAEDDEAGFRIYRDHHKLLLMNHFYSVRVGRYDENVNDYDYMMPRIRNHILWSAAGRYPTFVAVDYVNYGKNGGAKRVVIEINNQYQGGGYRYRIR